MDNKTKEWIKVYLDKAGKKLKVAQKLFKQEEYEDSISRAYYACFHAAQAILLSEGLSAKTHSGVSTLFNLHFIKKGKLNEKLAKYLRNLKDDREAVDYDAYPLLDEDDAETALEEAQEFIAAVKKYLKSKH